jgi:hypothetical protein
MRAIIRCHTDQTKELFHATLQQAGWWPEVPQESEEAKRHRQEILSLVASEDVGLVNETSWYMIFRYDKGKTWGLVNSPQHGIVEIRIKNNSSAALRTAAEHLVETIQNSTSGNLYAFRDIIDVLEPNSQHHAFYGKPLPTRTGEKWTLAKTERSWEWKAAVWLFSAAAVSVVASTPLVMQFCGSWNGHWLAWTEGFVGRLATSALVSGVVSLLTVVMHYQDLKRYGAIRWQLKQDGPVQTA